MEKGIASSNVRYERDFLHAFAVVSAEIHTWDPSPTAALASAEA
jgi:hypothetical protein